MDKIEYEGREVVTALMNVIDECIDSFERIAEANGVKGTHFIRIFNELYKSVDIMEKEIERNRNVR